MAILRNFTKSDFLSFSGAEPFPNKDVPPRIYYFTPEEMVEFYSAMEIEVDALDQSVYIIHDGSGMSLEWTVDDKMFHVGWPSGSISERNEQLLDYLDEDSLPLWAMSAAKAKYEEF